MGLGNGDVTVGVCPAIGLSVGVVALSVILPVTTPPMKVGCVTTGTAVTLMSGDCVERILLAVVSPERWGCTVRLTVGVV